MNKKSMPSVPASGPSRITGYDAARGIAVILMLIINFNSALADAHSRPSWLAAVIDLLDRRAAVAFVMLAGAGITLLSKISASNRLMWLCPGIRSELLKRCLFLFFAGTFLYTIWEGDILHFYAFYIASGIFLLNRSAKVLFTTAVLIWIFSFIPVFSDSLLFYEGSFDNALISPFQDALFTGYYPILPWIIFFIAGIWLGRQQQLNHPSFLKRFAAAGCLMIVSTETVFFAAKTMHLLAQSRPDGFLHPASGIIAALYMIADTDINSLSPFAVISGLGTAILIIAAGVFTAERFRLNAGHPLMIAGRTSLTLYISHIILIVAFRSAFDFKDIENLWVVLTFAGLFFTAYIHLLKKWLRHHPRGPVENLMRRFLIRRAAGPAPAISSRA